MLPLTTETFVKMDSSLIVDKVRKNTSPPYNEANNSFTSGVPQSPVLIRQYTVREIVTPTKTGKFNG